MRAFKIPAFFILLRELLFVLKYGFFLSGKEFSADFFHRHILAGPDAESGGSLIKEHIHAIEGFAAGGNSILQEARAAWIEIGRAHV